MGSVNKVSAPVAVRINIGSLLLDVRLAILSIRKSAPTNLAHLACYITFVMMIVPVFQRPQWKMASFGDSRTRPI
jgi:hypothetical protein